MHKCFKCGTEFEGGFCPECGTRFQEEKHCPQCGALLAGSAKFCNNCGYSFLEPAKKEKKPSKVGAFFKKVWTWIRAHLKIVIPSAVALVAVVVILSLIPTFILMGVNGTYYASLGGELSEQNYVTLSSGKWTDSDGLEGRYSLSGKNITLEYEDPALKELGELLGGDADATVRLEGTIKNDVLTLKDKNREQVFVTKSHSHKYGEWEVTHSPTCTAEGEQQRICACKKFETEKVAIIPHDYGWQTTVEPTCTEEGEQIYICSMCRETAETQSIAVIPHDYAWQTTTEPTCTEKGEQIYICSMCQETAKTEKVPPTRHRINEDWLCTVCDMQFTKGLEYRLKSDSSAYFVSGIGSASGDIVILDYYNGKPVTSIEYATFRGCSSLTSITIPYSVTSIESSAFSRCSGLTSITIGSGVTSIRGNAFYNCYSLTNITFQGTKAEWKAIKKEFHWDYETSNFIVQCTDGKLDKNGNEIS